MYESVDKRKDEEEAMFISRCVKNRNPSGFANCSLGPRY